MDQPLVAGRLRRRRWVGRMRVFSRGERYWRLGLCGQHRACWGHPARHFLGSRCGRVRGGGVLAGEGEIFDDFILLLTRLQCTWKFFTHDRRGWCGGAQVIQLTLPPLAVLCVHEDIPWSFGRCGSSLRIT